MCRAATLTPSELRARIVGATGRSKGIVLDTVSSDSHKLYVVNAPENVRCCMRSCRREPKHRRGLGRGRAGVTNLLLEDQRAPGEDEDAPIDNLEVAHPPLRRPADVGHQTRAVAILSRPEPAQGEGVERGRIEQDAALAAQA